VNEEFFFRPRQRNQRVSARNGACLGLAMGEPRIGFVPYIVFGSIHRVHVVNEGLSRYGLYCACHMPEHRRVEMQDVGTPFLNRTNTNLNGI
jgi:hypothetical protein